MRLWSYLFNLLRGVDELGNAALDGNSRQTISSRSYEGCHVRKPRLARWCVMCFAVDCVNYAIQLARFQKPYAHCKDAYMSDQKDRTY